MRDAQVTLRMLDGRAGPVPAYWWTVPGLMGSLHRAGRLPRVAGAAKEKTAVKNGKATEGATWSDGLKVEAGDDCVVPSGFTVEQNSAIVARSWRVTGTGGLSGSATMTVGASTAGPSNVLVSFASTAKITWTGGILISTTAAEPQTIALGGHTLAGSLKNNGLIALKVKLLESLTAAAAIAIEGAAGSVFDLNEKTVQGTTVEFRSSLGELKCSNAKIVVAGEFTGSLVVAATTVVGSNSCTLELVNGTESEWEIKTNGLEWDKIVATKNVRVAQSPTVKTEFAVHTAGAAAGKGAKVTQGSTVTLATTAVLTSDGTSEAQARLESSEAGKPAKVKATSEQEVASWLKIKDITVEAGPVYAPHGTDEGGNLTVGTTLIFSAKPGLKGSMAGTATLAGRLQGPGNPVGSTAGTATLRGAASATGTPRGALAGSSGLAGRPQAAGTPHGALAALSGLAGRLQAAGKPRGLISAASALAGRAQSAGTPRGSFTSGSALHGTAGAAGQLVGRLSGVGVLVGRLQAAGTALRGVFAGVSGLAGRAQAPGMARGGFSSAAGARGAAQAGGTPAGAVVGVASLLGRLAGVAGLRGRLEAVSGWLWHVPVERPKRPVDVELSIVPLVGANVKVWPTVAADVELVAAVGGNVQIKRGG